MHRLSTLLLLLLVAISTAMAKPARRVAVRLVQPDGTTIGATYSGDEHLAFYVDDAGRRLKREADGWWRAMPDDETATQDEVWTARRLRAAASTTSAVPSTGEHRLLALLVEFPDLRFTDQGSPAYFEQMLNGDDFTSPDEYNSTGSSITRAGNAGSARQYFIDQSRGLYKPIFDIVGPIMLDNGYAFYGRKVGSVNDVNPREMVREACNKALSDSLITDLSVYDSDDDGYVDLVYIFYAGYSQAEHAGDDYIWPHQGTIGGMVSKSGIRVSRYACSSELQDTPQDTTITLDGIGSCVHEFGHALGLPDFYNTGTQRGCYGMEAWDVMDQGCYNGDGRVPCSYTAHERHMMGWTTLVDLPVDTDLTLLPFDTANVAYVVYNPANRNEYYTLEYHQSKRWDKFWGGYTKVGKSGMLITHVDYLSSSWSGNRVNTDPAHQRCTVVPADGHLWAYDSIASMTAEQRQAWYDDYRGDVFPGRSAATSCDFTASPFFKGAPVGIQLDNIHENAGCELRLTVVGATNALPAIGHVATGIDATYDLTGRRLSPAEAGRRRGMHIERRSDGTSRIVIR